MPSIALDLAYLEPGATGGMETYARELVPRLRASMPDAAFSVLCGAELAEEWNTAPWADDCRVISLSSSSASRARRTALEYTQGAVRLRTADLVHGLGNVVPVVPGVKRVVTIHDCIHFRYPDTTSFVLSRGMRTVMRVNVRCANRIITVSESSKQDLVDLLNARPDCIDVVPSGPGTRFLSVVEASEIDVVRERIGAGDRPIVLSVSARRPHKNLGVLIRALAQLPDEVLLVLPGYPTAFDADLRRVAREAGVADRVAMTGWLDDRQLEALYATARCMALPTLAEGFGLPILESAVRGVPVAASDIPVLREVGGNAVAYFDPHSPTAVASTISLLLRDSTERDRLIDAARLRVDQFSWDAAARATADVYRRLLLERPA